MDLYEGLDDKRGREERDPRKRKRVSSDIYDEDKAGDKPRSRSRERGSRAARSRSPDSEEREYSGGRGGGRGGREDEWKKKSEAFLQKLNLPPSDPRQPTTGKVDAGPVGYPVQGAYQGGGYQGSGGYNNYPYQGQQGVPPPPQPQQFQGVQPPANSYSGQYNNGGQEYQSDRRGGGDRGEYGGDNRGRSRDKENRRDRDRSGSSSDQEGRTKSGKQGENCL